MGTRRARGAAMIANPNFVQHPFLQFDHEDYTPQLRDTYQSNLEANIGQPIEASDVLDWAAMDRIIDDSLDGETGTETLGRVLTMRYMLPTGNVGIVSSAWFNLFHVDEIIWHELVLEFFSTLHFDSRSSDYRRGDLLTFQLGGEPRSLSLVDFAVAIGLYSADETYNPYFDEHLAATRTVKYTSLEVAETWPLVGNFDYGHRSPSYTFIRSPVHRLIHRLLALSIAARREGPEKVHGPDMFYLGSIVQGTLVNVPWLLANWMWKKATGARSTSSICGGQYVTRIARYLNVEVTGCTPVAPGMGVIRIPTLEELDIVRSAASLGLVGNRLYWMTHLLPGQHSPARGGRQAGRGVVAAGRGGRVPGRGRGRGPMDIDTLYHEMDTRFRDLRLEWNHHFAYQVGMMHQLLDDRQIPWQPYVPYDFGGPGHQPEGDDSGEE